MKVEIDIPEIPKELNPDGYPVEFSPIGQCRIGAWPFALYEDNIWRQRGDNIDSPGTFTARLVEPKKEGLRDVPPGFLALPMRHPEDRCPYFDTTDYTYTEVQGQQCLWSEGGEVYVLVGYMRGHEWNESGMSLGLLFPHASCSDALPDYAIFRTIRRSMP